MDGWMVGCMDEIKRKERRWKKERMDGKKEGWMDRWMDKWVKVGPYMKTDRLPFYYCNIIMVTIDAHCQCFQLSDPTGG
jgi:hypothetical protein